MESFFLLVNQVSMRFSTSADQRPAPGPRALRGPQQPNHLGLVARLERNASGPTVAELQRHLLLINPCVGPLVLPFPPIVHVHTR